MSFKQLAGLTPSTGTRIASATTTLVKTGDGIFRRIAITDAVAAQTYTFYDATTATGTPIAVFNIPANATSLPFSVELNIGFSTGLTCVSTGTCNAVVGVD